jgi:hypothetical protein
VEAVAELLSLVRVYWERDSEELENKLAVEQEHGARSGDTERDDDDASGDDWFRRRGTRDVQGGRDSEQTSRYPSFLGLPPNASDVERAARDQIEMHDANDNLVGWLAGPPMLALVRAIIDLSERTPFRVSIDEFGPAQTKEDLIRYFLARFGYIEDRHPPQGIKTIREMFRAAKNDLLTHRDDVHVVIGSGALIGRAIESTLQVLVMFYGQYLMPDIFAERVSRREELTGEPAERKAWWSRVSLEVAPTSKWAIGAYVEKGNTYIAALIAILEALEDRLVSQDEARFEFVTRFGRDGILPASALAEKSTKPRQSSRFIDLLNQIKDLRNTFDHGLNRFERPEAIPPMSEVLHQADELIGLSSILFEEGYRQRLFPEVLLIRRICQNIRRKWQVYAINEGNNEVLFSVSDVDVELLLPDCEVFCWPPDHVSTSGSVPTPRVICRKYWRLQQ